MSDSEQKMIRYLLAELSDAEQTALEQSYFDDPVIFDQLMAVESELVDNYTRGLLSAETRARFEQYYLAHPQRLERARFAEALARKIDSEKLPSLDVGRGKNSESLWSRLLGPLRFPRLAWAAALVIVFVALGGWLYLKNQRQRQLAQSQTPNALQEQQQQEQLANAQKSVGNQGPQTAPSEESSPTLSASPAPHRSVSLALTVAGVRGGESGPPATLVIPAGTEEVKLQISLRENDYTKYEVAVQPVRGSGIFHRAGLLPNAKKRGATIVVSVPAGRFASGDYALMLKGVSQGGEVEDVSKMFFRVVK